MQFKVVYTEYDERGSLTNRVHADYFGTADSAENRFNELNNLRRAETGFHVYKVDLYIETYKLIDDPASFFEQFHAD